MKILSHPSPNADSRGGVAVDMLVLHYTGMPTGYEALARLCDPEAKVSAHYLVEEDGRIFALVDEAQRAWHAGVAGWRGRTDVNARSIGIEIVNPGHEWGYRPFPEAQMDAVIALCQSILERYAIAPRDVVGHSDVAPARKSDPGELFDWARLAREGIGLFPMLGASPAKGCQPDDLAEKTAMSRREAPAQSTATEGSGDLAEKTAMSRREAPAQSIAPVGSEDLAEKKLLAYGYDVANAGLTPCITAFQRHFRPERVDGVWDAECQALLDSLLSQCQKEALQLADI